MVHIGKLYTAVPLNPVLMSVQSGAPCKWTTDSKRFILDNFDTIQDCPARMYNVAPIFCPPSSWLHGCYSSEFSHRIKAVVGPAQWEVCIRTVLHVGDTSPIAYWSNHIATPGPTLNDIIILDALTGSQTATLSGHTNWVTSLTYSLDGIFLVSGSSDNTIKLWDVQTGGVIKTLRGHTNQVCSVSISADCTMIASASDDRTICLWNVRTGNSHIIEKYTDYAKSVTFSPQNSQLLFSSGNGTVQQWDIHGHKIGSPAPGNKVVFSLDGTQFVSQKDSTVAIRNSDSKMTTVEFNLGSDAHHCCFSPNGKFIAVAAFHAIYLWDITGSGPSLIQTLIGHSGSVTSLVFSSPFNLISASNDKSIKFWQIGVPSVDPVLSDPESSSLTSSPIIFVSLQARDGLAFSIDLEGVVRTWDILTGHCKKSYKTQIKRVEHVDIQLVSNRVIIVWKELLGWEINVWDAEEGKLHTVGKPGGYAQGLRMIGDGSRVLQLYGDSVQVWDIWTKDGESFDILQIDSSVEFFCFDPLRMDSAKVLVRLGDSSVQGWDFGTPGSTPIQFSGTSPLGRPHLNFIDVRNWSKDSPVRVEDGITGKEVFRLYDKYSDPSPSATQWDGRYLIAGYHSGEVVILDFNDALPQ